MPTLGDRAGGFKQEAAVAPALRRPGPPPLLPDYDDGEYRPLHVRVHEGGRLGAASSSGLGRPVDPGRSDDRDRARCSTTETGERNEAADPTANAKRRSPARDGTRFRIPDHPGVAAEARFSADYRS